MGWWSSGSVRKNSLVLHSHIWCENVVITGGTDRTNRSQWFEAVSLPPAGTMGGML